MFFRAFGFRAALLFALAASACASGQTPDANPVDALPPPVEAAPAADVLPTGDEIFRRCIEAMGGEAKLRSVKNAASRGTFSMPAQGLSGSLRVLQSAPNWIYTEVTLPVLGKSLSGFDGVVAWATNMMSGPRLPAGKELAQNVIAADFHMPLTYRTHYPNIQVVERKVFEEEDVYAVRMVSVNGDTEMRFFSVESGLEVGSEKKVATEMGDVPVTSAYKNYAPMGGIMQPMLLIQRQGPVEIQMRIDSIVYDDPAFERLPLPDDVQALIREQSVEPTP